MANASPKKRKNSNVVKMADVHPVTFPLSMDKVLEDFIASANQIDASEWKNRTSSSQALEQVDTHLDTLRTKNAALEQTVIELTQSLENEKQINLQIISKEKISSKKDQAAAADMAAWQTKVTELEKALTQSQKSEKEIAHKLSQTQEEVERANKAAAKKISAIPTVTSNIAGQAGVPPLHSTKADMPGKMVFGRSSWKIASAFALGFVVMFGLSRLGANEDTVPVSAAAPVENKEADKTDKKDFTKTTPTKAVQKQKTLSPKELVKEPSSVALEAQSKTAVVKTTTPVGTVPTTVITQPSSPTNPVVTKTVTKAKDSIVQAPNTKKPTAPSVKKTPSVKKVPSNKPKAKRLAATKKKKKKKKKKKTRARTGIVNPFGN